MPAIVTPAAILACFAGGRTGGFGCVDVVVVGVVSVGVVSVAVVSDGGAGGGGESASA